ncbi:MAG: phosphate transporter permease subunit PstC, partial [Verrucomicrobiota bacterium]
MSQLSNSTPDSASRFPIHKRRLRFLGLTVEDCIKSFFGGNALISVVVLGLITFFLIKEGAGFLGQNRQNLAIYRLAGLEYVDHLRRQSEDHTALTRYLSDLRLRSLNHLTGPGGLTLEAANGQLAAFDDYAARFGDAADPLRGLVSDLSEVATAIKTKFLVNEDKKEERRQLLAEGKVAEAGAVVITSVDFPAELKPLRDALPAYREANREFAARPGIKSVIPREFNELPETFG